MRPSEPDPARCSECGEPANRRGLPISQSIWPARSWAPVLVTLAAVLALSAWVGLDVEKLVGSSGSFVPRALAPGWTFQEVEQLTRGAAPDGYAPGSLTRGLQVETRPLSLQVGSTAIEVGFGDPPPRLTEIWMRGWPIAWMRTTRTSGYENAFSGTGWTPARTDPTQPFQSLFSEPRDLTRAPERPRWVWTGGSLVHQPPPERTGGALVDRVFRIPALLFPVAFSLLLIAAALATIRIFSLIRRRRVSARLRRRVWLAAGLIAIAGMAITLLYSTLQRSYRADWVRVKQATFPPAPVYRVYTNLARLPLTREALLEMKPTADSDQQVAAAIIKAVASSDPAVDPEGLLALAAVREGYVSRSDLRYYGRRFKLFETSRGAYVRRGDFGPVEKVPLEHADIHLDRQYATLRVRLPLGSSSETFSITLLLGQFIPAVLLLLLVWLAARQTALAVLRRRARRRRRDGRCTACGYQLSAC